MTEAPGIDDLATRIVNHLKDHRTAHPSNIFLFEDRIASDLGVDVESVREVLRTFDLGKDIRVEYSDAIRPGPSMPSGPSASASGFSAAAIRP